LPPEEEGKGLNYCCMEIRRQRGEAVMEESRVEDAWL